MNLSIADLPPSALSGIRVIEVAGSTSQYCGKMFAELGADVILVEPPNGATTRNEEPFVGDQAGRYSRRSIRL